MPARIVEVSLTSEHNQAVVLSGKRRVDSDHILFKLVRWCTIQMLASTSHLMNPESSIEESKAWADIAKWIGAILGAGISVLAIILALYAFFFWDQEISSDAADWGVFGDFVGGLANPFLSFLTIVLLAMTLILQVRQLKISAYELRLSREELEMSRAELRRSASAQELSEKALRAQASAAAATAQLATISALLDHYRDEILKHQGMIYSTKDPRRAKLEELQNKYATLQDRLDQFYSNAIGEKNEQV